MNEPRARGVYELGNWLFQFSEEWSEWFRKGYNWRNFTLIKAYFEDEVHMGNREVDLRLLGLGVRIMYSYNRQAEGQLRVRDALAELEGKHSGDSGFNLRSRDEKSS